MTDRRRHLDRRQEQARARAVQLLQHYIGLLMKRTGLRADADTDAEMEQLVDELLEAATPGKTAHEEAVRGDDRVVVGIVGLTGDDEPDPRGLQVPADVGTADIYLPPAKDEPDPRD